MGTVALGAGALDDAAAWCLLAIVLASFDGDLAHAVTNIAGGIGYVAVALLVIRPLLARWGRGVEERGELSEREFVLLLALMAFGAWFTDLIGLHAVFGAFVMGIAMPRGLVTKELIGALPGASSASAEAALGAEAALPVPAGAPAFAAGSAPVV